MRRFGLVAFVLVCLTGGASAAVTPAGRAVGVNPSATAEAATSRTLVVGSDVAMGDKIVTGSSGQVQLIFNDDTHLVIGPSSSLVLASYLLRGDKSVGQFAINALGGSFRFITGKSDHSAYTINTPTGTIGVRGTAFDFIVDPRKAIIPGHQPGTSVALFRGAVQLCDLKGKCVVLSRQCDLGGTSTVDAFTVGHNEAADAGARARFRYIASQKPLLQPFWITESRLCYMPTNAGGGSLVAPMGGAATPRLQRGTKP